MLMSLPSTGISLLKSSPCAVEAESWVSGAGGVAIDELAGSGSCLDKPPTFGSSPVLFGSACCSPAGLALSSSLRSADGRCWGSAMARAGRGVRRMRQARRGSDVQQQHGRGSCEESRSETESRAAWTGARAGEGLPLWPVLCCAGCRLRCNVTRCTRRSRLAPRRPHALTNAACIQRSWPDGLSHGSLHN